MPALRISLLLLFFLLSCSKKSNDLTNEYPDILNIKNLPIAAVDRNAACFFDKGAWHGFALVPDSVQENFGGFSGPFLMNEWRWISKQLLAVTLNEQGKRINLSEATLVKNSYMPGRLVHKLKLPNWDIELKLIFSSARTALIIATFTNTSQQKKEISTGWEGDWHWENARFSTNEKGMAIHLPKSQHFLQLTALPFSNAHIDTAQKQWAMPNIAQSTVNSGESIQQAIAVSYFSGAKMQKDEQKNVQKALSNSQEVFNTNRNRWNGYLKNIFVADSPFKDKREYREIAVKSLLTLVNNWKAPLGDLKHAGLIPSYNIWYFNGFWAWDSWKHAVALSWFEPQLAKDQIRTMFDYQDEAGMVADCIYVNEAGNNYRDTKPPLASWAVRAVFNKTKDVAFLEEMYPKLVKYHAWWYKWRDHNQNGLCEYGSTDTTAVAARWESGMDNAVRFDDIKMLPNGKNAASMDQESVDLNAYLYKEKRDLAYLAGLLGKKDEATRYDTQANALKEQVRAAFYDTGDGFFYDRKIPSNNFVRIQAPEGWTPLWTEVATQEQAAQVIKVMQDSSRFSTYYPFPTVSKAHPQFSKGYWRGPVWLDQVYFAIDGLKKYGYRNEALAYTQHIFDRAEGLKNSGMAIRENYNPINGKGVRVRHFSWSAAHLLLLYMDK